MVFGRLSAIAKQRDSSPRYSSPSDRPSRRYSIYVAVIHALAGSLSYPGIYNFFDFLNTRLADNEIDAVAAPITMMDLLFEGSSLINQIEMTAGQGSALCSGLLGCQPVAKGAWCQGMLYALEKLRLEENNGIIWFATAPWWSLANDLIEEYGHEWGTRFVIHKGDPGSTVLVPQMAFPLISSTVEVLEIPPYILNTNMSVAEKTALFNASQLLRDEFDKVIKLTLSGAGSEE